jgi:23S rRNA pseudouridine1911/1915/1917 synthase
MEEKISVIATEAHKGLRLDRFLVEHGIKGFSRAHIQRLVKSGNILLNGAPVKSHHTVAPGDSVDITVPAPKVCEITAEKIPLDIVYEDKDLLIVNKVQEMVVHPAPGNFTGTLVNALLWHCKHKHLSGIGGVMKPGIVHRIDKGTSGLLIVAKNDKAHRALAQQFKDKTTKRIYHALVKGVVEHDNGIVELAIGRCKYDRKKMEVVEFDEDDECENAGKLAITQYRVLERFKEATLLELKLGTGRTHQIRVHMAHIGHPIVGDEKYGSRAAIGRPALHAKVIGFTHPTTKKFMEFDSELPKDIQKAIRAEKKKASV